MTARLITVAVWAAAAASLAFWGLRVLAQPGESSGVAVATAPAGADSGLWPQVWGQAPAVVVADEEPEPQDDRFELLGVVAAPTNPRSSQGVALIAVDGEPARAIRVGAAVDGETVLLAVHKRGVELGPRGGETDVALELPDPNEALATASVLPVAGGNKATPPGTRPGGMMRPGMQPNRPITGGVPVNAPVASPAVPHPGMAEEDDEEEEEDMAPYDE